MPVLVNPRHELFAQELAKGKTATQAMQAANYSDPRNSTRLTKKDEIRRRVAELQTITANKAAITIQSICAELDEANQVAKAKGQAAAMVSASTLRAKLAGLLREKVEISDASEFSQYESIEKIAEALLREHDCLTPTQQQIEQVTAIFESFLADLAAVAKGRPPITIDARPIKGSRRAFR